jgi:sarcosine oxidase, subunit gamma
MRLSPLEPWFRQSPLAAMRPATGCPPSASLLATDDEGAVLRLEDLSLRSRFGCKGPGAETWLATAGYRVPPEPNSAAIDVDGVLVARIATAEFLVEATDGASGRVESTLRRLNERYANLDDDPPARPSDVYPVARQDLVIGIEGAATNALLRQTCSFDFAPLLQRCEPEAGSIILTSMLGVSVAAFVRRTDRGPVMTLWVDPSFAHYFWTTLLEVGGDLGRININESRRALE